MSNLIYLLAALVILGIGKQTHQTYNVWIIEILSCLNVSFISAMYHLCDNGTYCISQYEFLHVMDYICAICVMSAGFTLHIPNKQIIKVLINFAILILTTFYEDNMYYSVAPTIIIVGGWVGGTNMKKYWRTKKIKLWFYIILAIGLFIGAYIIKTDATPKNYNVWHSIWHLLTGSAIISSSMAVREFNKKKTFILPF